MDSADSQNRKSELSPELKDAVQHMERLTFPGGQQQIEAETDALQSLLGGKLSKEEARFLLRRTKALLVLSQDKSETRVVPSIMFSVDGKLSREEAQRVYAHLTGISGPLTSGGDGSCAEQAVAINTTSALVGVAEEYAYIERICGKRDADYTLEMQMQITQNARNYDVIYVKIKAGTQREFWFDITSFFGRP
jgi:hypothetical protein